MTKRYSHHSQQGVFLLATISFFLLPAYRSRTSAPLGLQIEESEKVAKAKSPRVVENRKDRAVRGYTRISSSVNLRTLLSKQNSLSSGFGWISLNMIGFSKGTDMETWRRR